MEDDCISVCHVRRLSRVSMRGLETRMFGDGVSSVLHVPYHRELKLGGGDASLGCVLENIRGVSG